MQFAVYVVDMNDCWPKWSNLTWRNIWKELLSLESNSQDWLRWRETIQDLNIILPTLYLRSNTGVIMEQLIELFLDVLQYCFSIGSFSINIAGGNLVDTIMLTNNDKIIETSFVEMDSTSQGTLIHMSIVPVEYFLGIKW